MMMLHFFNTAMANIIVFEVDQPSSQQTTISSGEIYFSEDVTNRVTQIAQDTKVSMEISGIIARVKVEQTFINPTSYQTEGVYVFPLPENSAVDTLVMRIDGRVIKGEIKRKKEAREIYEKAKQAGQKASLLTQQRPNIFTTRVANIPAHGKIIIQIEYQQAVEIDNNRFSIRFPTKIGERYIPGIPIPTPYDSIGTAPNTHLVADASEITPASVADYLRPISIDVDLNAGFQLGSIESAYHEIKVREHNVQSSSKYISLARGKVASDRDFELVWTANRLAEPQVALFTQSRGEEKYLMLMATPPIKLLDKQSQVAREVIFIIDSSGSMQGQSMSQAKQALAQAIHRLSSIDRFNIIDFDSTFTPLFSGAKKATKHNRDSGIKFAHSLIANGGTEIAQALEYALVSRQSDSSHYLRQIIVLTDGQVGNEDQVFDLVRKQIKNDRLFTVGIGSTPNSHLMTKLAQFGGGTFTYIGKVSEVSSKMNDLFGKLESPVLTNIEIDLSGAGKVEQALSGILDLYADETMTAIFKVSKLPEQIRISGQSEGGDFSKLIHIQSIGDDSSGIDKLWARRKIDHLNDQYQNAYSQERLRIEREITNFALNYHLVSQFTSLVAKDDYVSFTQEKQVDQESTWSTSTSLNGVTLKKMSTTSSGYSGGGSGISFSGSASTTQYAASLTNGASTASASLNLATGAQMSTSIGPVAISVPLELTSRDSLVADYDTSRDSLKLKASVSFGGPKTYPARQAVVPVVDNKYYLLTGGGSTSTLKSRQRTLTLKNSTIELSNRYMAALYRLVFDKWSFSGAQGGWGCEVYIAQDENGSVIDIKLDNCTVDYAQAQAFKDAIIDAVQQASPLPISLTPSGHTNYKVVYFYFIVDPNYGLKSWGVIF